MEEIITGWAGSFNNFYQSKIKGIKNNRTLVSFVYSPDSFPQLNITYLNKLHESFFYFEKPSMDFFIAGLDKLSAISENGESRFSVTDKMIKELSPHFITNSELKDLPLFLGAMKFNTRHADTEWTDFSNSCWFIPELLLLKKNSGYFIILNFFSGVPFEVLKKKFSKKIELFFTQTSPRCEELPKIVTAAGNKPKDRKKWKQTAEKVLDLIRDEKVKKVVLSRRVDLVLSGEPGAGELIDTLRNRYSNCYLFLYRTGKSTFFGASPELLASFKNRLLTFDALAGSAPRGKNETEDAEFENELLKSTKDAAEHNFVIEHIKSSLKAFAGNINKTAETSVKKFSNIQHLYTPLSGTLIKSNSLFSLLKELFPTPAVSGYPKETAIKIIKSAEEHDRGLYAGFTGWFNLFDEGEFVVTIRSALLLNKKLFAYAGCGIVADSDPDKEFIETELKLKPILNLFRNDVEN